MSDDDKRWHPMLPHGRVGRPWSELSEWERHEVISEHADWSSAELSAMRWLAIRPGTHSGGSGDFSIGSNLWPGTSKLLEEMGELQQVLGKLIATHGGTAHWSGNLRTMLVEEMADVLAALSFFGEHNMTEEERTLITTRMEAKFERFKEWHKQPKLPGEGER